MKIFCDAVISTHSWTVIQSLVALVSLGASHKPFLFPCWNDYEVTTGTLGQTHVWFWFMFQIPFIGLQKAFSSFLLTGGPAFHTQLLALYFTPKDSGIQKQITFRRTHILIHTSFMCTLSLLYPRTEKRTHFPNHLINQRECGPPLQAGEAGGAGWFIGC